MFQEKNIKCEGTSVPGKDMKDGVILADLSSSWEYVRFSDLAELKAAVDTKLDKNIFWLWLDPSTLSILSELYISPWVPNDNELTSDFIKRLEGFYTTSLISSESFSVAKAKWYSDEEIKAAYSRNTDTITLWQVTLTFTLDENTREIIPLEWEYHRGELMSDDELLSLERALLSVKLFLPHFKNKFHKSEITQILSKRWADERLLSDLSDVLGDYNLDKKSDY